MNDTTSAAPSLLPCPFCGGDVTLIHVNKGIWHGSGYGEPVSVEVRHWCESEQGQPSRMISRAGRDEASAIAAWNRRAQETPPAVAEPLTVQQIWASDEIMSANAMPMDNLLRIVRAVEAAHGIGIKNGGSNGN